MRYEIVNLSALRSALQDMSNQLCMQSVSEQSVFNCKLVASELLSNVLQHGGGKAFASVSLEQSTFRICVRGEKEFRPPEKSSCSGVDKDNGRGLFLVDAYSESRTYSPEDGICVTVKIEYLSK